jgi:hypothetical protein
MVVTDVDTNHLLRIQEIEERFHSNLLSTLFLQGSAQKRRRDKLQRTVELMRRAKLLLDQFAR